MVKKTIQIFLMVCAVTASIISEVSAQQKEQMGKMCQEKTKVSTELLDAVKAGNFPEGNKELKCYVGCIMEQVKSMKDGKLDKESSLQMIQTNVPENLREVAKKALTVCAGKVDSIVDPCDLAWEMVKCFKNEDPNFILPM